jgi:hypothetical protein
MTKRWRFFPIALCALSVACGGGKSEAPGKGGPATAGKPTAVVEAPTRVVEAPKATVIAKFRLGPAFGPEGTVNSDVSVFRPGEPIFTSFEIANAPQGSKVHVAWATLPDKKAVARQEAPLSGQARRRLQGGLEGLADRRLRVRDLPCRAGEGSGETHGDRALQDRPEVAPGRNILPETESSFWTG